MSVSSSDGVAELSTADIYRQRYIDVSVSSSDGVAELSTADIYRQRYIDACLCLQVTGLLN